MARVVLLTNIPTPYRIPLFNTMAQIFSKSGIDLRILFYSRTYARRMWQHPLAGAAFKYSILKSFQIRLSHESYLFVPVNLLDVLLREKPEVIIALGFSFATGLVCLFSMLTGIPYIIWSGDIGREHQLSIRHCVRKIIARRASAFIAYGTKSGEYLRTLDVERPLFYGWNTIDTDFFSERVRFQKANKIRILETLDCERNSLHLLTVSYLTKGKSIDCVFNVLRILRNGERNFVLHIVGDGADRNRLENMVKQYDLMEYVRFWGYKQKEELVDYYAIADLFIFASTYDIWGLVLVEAMSAGVPVIASKYAGATCDLITDGVNGFTIDPYDTEEFAKKIQILMADQELRACMAQKAKETIQMRFTVEKSAQGFLQAVRHAMKL